MSLIVKVDGLDSFEVSKECVQKVKFQAEEIPAEDAAAYRQVTVEIVEAGLIERKYSFPRAFVVDYKEEYGNTDGIGTFRILIKQKKDKLDLVSVDGGYAGA